MKKWMINHQGNLKACNKVVSAMQPYIDYVMLCDNKPNDKYNCITLSVDSTVNGNILKGPFHIPRMLLLLDKMDKMASNNDKLYIM